ncbi:hypothetical protein K0C01_05890 [Salinarchaeum sp. IM2453]|uniref:DUF7269 family protein n=1 Tax=Salinarchaeum sp. IM2453 TaxID=2862870 RepID=UPI001C82D0FF|nr:hypothetical protein [Salinarchaeum sp. IM2453]QZA89651.1 hypothetical protein K0C01_05890 [Salinarchaeum sp. IM2453]
MRWRTVFGIIAGGSLVAVGGILALAPEIVPSDIWQQVLLYSSWIETIPISYVVGGLIALAALLYLRTQTAGSEYNHQLYSTDPTQVHQPSPEIGDAFDQAVEMEHLHPYIPEQRETHTGNESEYSRFQQTHIPEHWDTHQSANDPQQTSFNQYRPSVNPADSLQETLENVLRQTHDPNNVDEIIEQGEWTSNQVAAAAMSTHQDFPLSHRILRWLQPDLARQREFEQTSSEVYRTVAEYAPDYDAGDQ